MEKIIFVLIAIIPFTGCTNNTILQVEKFKQSAYTDSAILAMNSKEDSEISSYMDELRGIGENLDQISLSEKIINDISTGKKSLSKDSLISAINAIDSKVILTGNKMNVLKARVGKMSVRNKNLESILVHFSHEMNQKSVEITNLQSALCKSNSFLIPLLEKYNDSLIKFNKDNIQSVINKTRSNNAFFLDGTIKELQNLGIINLEGMFTGSSNALRVNSGDDNSMYAKKDLTNLKGIGLKGKFGRLITTHPEGAYSIIPEGKNDSIAITDPLAFWCESKYLVVAVK